MKVTGIQNRMHQYSLKDAILFFILKNFSNEEPVNYVYREAEKAE